MKTSPIFAAFAVVVGLVLTGCGPAKDSHSGHDHGHGHAHSPKMGGQLVEIGDHLYNAELLSDRAAGKLTLWVLDGHAENFLRVTNESFTVVFTVGGKEEAVVLRAAANPATGERVGETAQFEGQAEVLKTAGALMGRLPEATIRGKTFTDVSFQLEK
jgi:hypothetical protein